MRCTYVERRLGGTQDGGLSNELSAFELEELSALERMPVMPAKVRNCRECSVVLPASRYFHCEVCLSALETDGDDLDLVKPRAPHVHSDSKECSDCHQVKPVADFWQDTQKRTGRYSACRACMKAKYSRRRAPETGRAA
jgi:hypothetical protein